MAKSNIHPQFFHTLTPGFHTHLTIPGDFFSKYIGEWTVKKKTVELRSDASGITWKVEMTGRTLSDGWKEFTVAQNFEIGDVLVLRYVGDLVFHVLDLGPNCSKVPDKTPPRNNNDTQDDISKSCKTLLKKRLYPRTQVADDEDYIEFRRTKRVKKNNAETESFVVLVTASNLLTDTMNLPQHFTNSNGFSRKCHKIVVKDEGNRSWALDLAFNNSSDTFYVSRGWRNFCDDNVQTAGGYFIFKLVENGETPVLSCRPTEMTNDRRPSDCSEASWRESLSTGLSSEEGNIEGESSEDECSSMEPLIEMEKKKNRSKHSPYSLYSPCHKRSITFTLPSDYVNIRHLYLPRPFLRENGINKSGKMYLSGTDGKRWPVNLIRDSKGSIKMGAGWKYFVKAIGVHNFTLKLNWEDTTPVLSLSCADSSSDRGQEELLKAVEKQSLPTDHSNGEKICEDEINKEESRSLERVLPSNQKQFFTLKITPSSFRSYRLNLPTQFVRKNSMIKAGMINLCRKDGAKWPTTLTQDKDGRMRLAKGWIEFAEANELKSGDSFKVELIWEDATPMLSLVCSKAIEKEPVSTEPRSRDSSSAIQNRCVTLALTPEDVSACKLHLPSVFMKANGINKLGKITIVGEKRTKWSGYLLSRDGTVALGNGWVEFCEANGVKLGESFTLEFSNEQNTFPLLMFCSQKTTH